MMDSTTVNRTFYDQLWSNSRIVRPEDFNTWPLISGMIPAAAERLEIGPGLRPRLPLSGTNFIDLSPPAVERLAQHHGLAVTGNSNNLPYADEKFQLVCAFDVVEHVQDDRLVFREVSRVLADGGCFIVSVPLYAHLWTKFDECAGHVRRYEPSDLSALLAEHELVLESSAAYGMQPSSPWLLHLGLWCLENRRQEAMWCYNNILMPLGMYCQKSLKFIDGLIEAPGVDEIVLVCRKRKGTTPHLASAGPEISN
jgi:SAM-dependent methyltransferase